jgi:hypothetical protein
VRPKRSFLEVCVFLGRTVKAPQVRRADRSSRSKVAHLIQIRHRDEVEPPITDWLREAYDLPDVLAAQAGVGKRPRKRPQPDRTTKTARASLETGGARKRKRR